jgi:hypothetical protein
MRRIAGLRLALEIVVAGAGGIGHSRRLIQIGVECERGLDEPDGRGVSRPAVKLREVRQRYAFDIPSKPSMSVLTRSYCQTLGCPTLIPPHLSR